MKILLIGPVPPDLGSNNTGGIARHLWSLADKLGKKGHDVSIVAIGRYYKPDRIVNGIKIYGTDNVLSAFKETIKNARRLLFNIGIIPVKKAYLHAFYSFFRLNAVEDLNGFDVIHLHGLHNAALHGLKILDVKRPKITTIHSYTGVISSDRSKSEKRVNYVNDYLKLTDEIIHVSKINKEKGQNYGLYPNKQEKIIYNGVEAAASNSFDHKPGICFVGYLIPSKRISLFLESAKYLKSDIREVHIAGDGPQREEVERAAKSNPVISCHGVLPNEEIRKMMRTFSLLVVPSTSESFGLVYIEALFEGMAVLGFGPVIKEFHEVMELTEQEKKLVVPVPPAERSARALAEKIDVAYQFRRSPEGNEAMSRVRQKAIQNFSWKTIIGRVENTYREIIKEN